MINENSTSQEIGVYLRSIPRNLEQYQKTHPTATYAEWCNSVECKHMMMVNELYATAIRKERPDILVAEEEEKRNIKALLKPQKDIISYKQIGFVHTDTCDCPRCRHDNW